MKYLIVTVIILLVAREGWSISCKVCDEGQKKPEESDTFSDIPDSQHKFFLMEDLCEDDTPQTTCNDDDELCVTWGMEFGVKNYDYYNNSVHDVTMNQYRCAKVNDVIEKAHCDEFKKWHEDSYDSSSYPEYYQPTGIKCNAEITKRGKFA